MASPCSVLADGAGKKTLTALGELAARECWRIERKWSRYRNDNIVHRINSANGATVTVDEETSRLIDYADLLTQDSEGAFDLSSGTLRRAWNFSLKDGRVPTRDAVHELMALVGWHRVTWRRPELTLPPGMEIDFGGIGKEYAVDRVAALLAAQTHLPVLVNLGGDIACTGPLLDGAPWQIGIASGVDAAATPCVHVSHGAVATSGDEHRHVEVDGIRYGHILDPRTGYPPADAARSVTVAAETCVEAGSLSTVALLQGAGAERWLASRGVDFHVVRDPGAPSARRTPQLPGDLARRDSRD